MMLFHIRPVLMTVAVANRSFSTRNTAGLSEDVKEGMWFETGCLKCTMRISKSRSFLPLMDVFQDTEPNVKDETEK